VTTPDRSDNGPPGFAAFVTIRYPALCRLGTLLTGDPHLGEDLAQSALIATLKAWNQLYPDGDPEGYTRVVMARQAARGARRKWRGELASAELPEIIGSDPAAAVDEADAARRLLRDLPTAWRVTLVLRFWVDLSEDQTAVAMKCSVGTVKSRTHRALARLRETARCEQIGTSS
jgi:RNA polymerase sigma-70 factor (sigma-E family)